jgi:hypothetical protein
MFRLQRIRLYKSKCCHEIDTHFMATDEMENNRGQLTVRRGDFCLGCVPVIEGSSFVN